MRASVTGYTIIIEGIDILWGGGWGVGFSGCALVGDFNNIPRKGFIKKCFEMMTLVETYCSNVTLLH